MGAEVNGRMGAAKLRRDGNSGFTMVELLVVVFLLSVIALAAQPSLNSSVDHAKLSAAADEVALALEFAQARAASSGLACRVTIDEFADTLAVEQLVSAADFMDGSLTEIDRDLAESISFRRVWHPLKRGKPYKLDFAGEPGFAGVEVVAAAFGAGNSVTFDAFGAPSDGGAVTIGQGGRQVLVTVDGLSGRVTVTGL